jgi:quercetin dioxygenase-like cupin family protein
MKSVGAGDLLSLSCNELPWVPSTFATGVFVKNVAVSDGVEMQLVRFEPGAKFPIHTHERPEFIFVLEGDLILSGQRLGPGWASVAAPGSTHADARSEEGCVFVLVDRA